MQTHFGVYGLIRRSRRHSARPQDARALCGAAGPGGGSPDPTDGDHAATLAREIAEETGLVLAEAGPWYEVEILVTQDSRGQQIALRHSGAWTVATVVIQPTDRAVVSSDASGWSWIGTARWRRRRDLSPLVEAVLLDAEARGVLGPPQQG